MSLSFVLGNLLGRALVSYLLRVCKSGRHWPAAGAGMR